MILHQTENTVFFGSPPSLLGASHDSLVACPTAQSSDQEFCCRPVTDVFDDSTHLTALFLFRLLEFDEKAN